MVNDSKTVRPIMRRKVSYSIEMREESILENIKQKQAWYKENNCWHSKYLFEIKLLAQ